MSEVLIVQARMSSTRFPGKVLFPLAEKPMLEHVIRRVQRCCVKRIVVATSLDVSDDRIEAFCQSAGIEFFRADLCDVAARFCFVLEKTGAERFIRICADSPCIDPALIDQAVALSNNTTANIVTNVFPRTFPKGQGVEVLHSDIFLKSQPFSTVDQKEHVTKYFYEGTSECKIINFSSGGQWGEKNMSVDTLQDMERMQKLFKKVGVSIYNKSWHELMYFMEQCEISA